MSAPPYTNHSNAVESRPRVSSQGPAPIRPTLAALWDETQRQKVAAPPPASKSGSSPASASRGRLTRRQLQELASMEVEEARQAGTLSFYTRILA